MLGQIKAWIHCTHCRRRQGMAATRNARCGRPTLASISSNMYGSCRCSVNVGIDATLCATRRRTKLFMKDDAADDAGSVSNP